jgi:hypothetical protein
LGLPLLDWSHVFDRLHGEESVQLAVIEGARVGSDKPLKKHARRERRRSIRQVVGTHWNLFGTKDGKTPRIEVGVNFSSPTSGFSMIFVAEGQFFIWKHQHTAIVFHF